MQIPNRSVVVCDVVGVDDSDDVAEDVRLVVGVVDWDVVIVVVVVGVVVVVRVVVSEEVAVDVTLDV